MSADESCYQIDEVEDPDMLPPRSKAEDSPMIKYCECPDGGYYYNPDEVHCYNGPEKSYSDDQILSTEGNKTRLFWNLEHCPISQGADLFLIYKRIKLCLHRMGVHGLLYIYAYGGKLSYTECQLHEAYISHTPLPPPKEWTIAGQICAEILRFVAGWPYRSVYVVIAKQDPDSEMTRLLHSLQSGHDQTLLTIEPHDGLFDSADSIFQCAEFVGGGKTSPQPGRRRLPSPPMPPPPVIATGVFWDVWDCPFPPTLTADSIYDAVQTCFTREVGLGKNMSMWAYVDEKKDSSTEFLGIKTWTSNIDFLPGKDTSATRHERMLHDILLWAIGLPKSAKHLLVAGRINQEMYRILEDLVDSSRSAIVLLIPSRDTVLASDTWPLDLLNHAYYIGCKEIESQSEDTDPKRH